MDENLAKLVKRLKVIRKELKEAVNIPHQVEFIEDINNILKPVSLELTMIVSNIDRTIVENIELLKASKKSLENTEQTKPETTIGKNALMFSDEVSRAIRKNQYYWFDSVLRGLFKDGDFKKIIDHVKYITAVKDGLVAGKEIDPINQKELILLNCPLEGHRWCEGIGTDGFINLRTKNYVLVLAPNHETNPDYPYIFEISASRKSIDVSDVLNSFGELLSNEYVVSEWVPVPFRNDQDVERFTSELSEVVSKLA